MESKTSSRGASPAQPERNRSAASSSDSGEIGPLKLPVTPASKTNPKRLKDEDVITGDFINFEELADEDLMKLCQDGDEDAFEAIFQRYSGPALCF